MSILSVTELFMERALDQQEKGLEMTRVFQVDTDAIGVGPWEVVNAAGIPELYSLTSNGELYVYQRTPVPFMDGVTWKVSVKYKLVPDGSSSPGGSRKPWDLDPECHFSFQYAEKVMEKCYMKNAAIAGKTRGTMDVEVVSSCNELFDPPAMYNDAMLVISIRRNKKHDVFSASNVEKYQNTINSADIRIAGVNVKKWCAWCRDYKADPNSTGEGEKYWTEAMEIVINRETWIRQIMDVGTHTFEQVYNTETHEFDNVYTAVKDSSEKQVMAAVPFDGAGAPLKKGTPFYYFQFHVLWEENWSGWLPTSAT